MTGLILQLLGLWLLLAASVTGCSAPRSALPSARSTPPTIGLSWDHPRPDVTFNLYSASVPSLSAMTLKTNTAARSVEFPATQAQEFFAIRAKLGDQLSAWGTK